VQPRACRGTFGELTAAVRVIAVPSLEQGRLRAIVGAMHLGRFMRRLRPECCSVCQAAHARFPRRTGGGAVTTFCISIKRSTGKYRYSRLWFRFMRRLNHASFAPLSQNRGSHLYLAVFEELAIRQLAGIRRHTRHCQWGEAAFLADSRCQPSIRRRETFSILDRYLYKYQGNVVKAVNSCASPGPGLPALAGRKRRVRSARQERASAGHRAGRGRTHSRACWAISATMPCLPCPPKPTCSSCFLL